MSGPEDVAAAELALKGMAHSEQHYFNRYVMLFELHPLLPLLPVESQVLRFEMEYLY